MNTKKKLWAICALSLAFNSIVMPMTNAAIRVPDVEHQESGAVRSMNKKGIAEVILDNAPWHKKAKRLVYDEKIEEYQHIREKIEFIFLPPYSPDLNPIEQCWRKTRKEVTHNEYFPDKYDLEYTLDWYFAKFNHPNESLASLCSFEWAS